jgi:3-phytase
MIRPFGVAVALLSLTGCATAPPPPASNAVDIRPAVATAQVPDDPDDPAFWVHPADPARSLIIGTNKVKAPTGALVVYDIEGKQRQIVSGLDRPNNVDVEYGFTLGGKPVDIAVTTERLQNRLRVFRISPDDPVLTDITGGTRVLADRTGEQSAPMGISLYKRPADGAIFAIVAPKEGPRDGYLAQYRLEDDGKGRVKATFVRYFGVFSGSGEIEAVAVDDALGYVYYADEGNGIHKYHADPTQGSAELAHFGKTGFRADREGIAIYPRPDGTGYIVCTDQIEGGSEYHLYPREGEPGRPHDHERLIKIVRGGADSTDGLEITPRALGPKFPNGAMAAMNSSGKNFLVYRWDDIAAALRPVK